MPLLSSPLLSSPLLSPPLLPSPLPLLPPASHRSCQGLLRRTQSIARIQDQVSGKSLGSGSMEWPRFSVSKGPIKQSELGSDAATNLRTVGEIRDHNEKLTTGLARVQCLGPSCLPPPILNPEPRALHELQEKHLGILLELEERKLALKMHFNRRCVSRSQRRRRGGSSLPKLLRPRTRQRHPLPRNQYRLCTPQHPR